MIVNCQTLNEAQADSEAQESRMDKLTLSEAQQIIYDELKDYGKDSHMVDIDRIKDEREALKEDYQLKGVFLGDLPGALRGTDEGRRKAVENSGWRKGTSFGKRD